MAGGLWNTLELLADGLIPAAVPAEWRKLAGADFLTLEPFLRSTNRLAGDFPCLAERGYGCRRELVPLDGDRWLARPDCETDRCQATVHNTLDLWIHELDAPRFGCSVGRQLGFGPPEGAKVIYTAPKIWMAGTHAATRSPVYLALCPNEAELLANLEGLASACGEPFILLAPTARVRTEPVSAFLQRERCAFIPLASSLAPDVPGIFRIIAAIEPIAERFQAGLTGGKGLVKTLERIDRNMEAVARDKYELRKENEELRQLNKDGYFNFAVRVNGDDFLAFAVIMALGNRKAAATHLKIPHRTFYNRVDQWASRGKEYQLMLRYMEWRKRNSRHLHVELNPSLQSGDAGDQPENPETMADVLETMKAADSKGYPEMLAEVLQALERQNTGNWMKVRQELVEMIKEDAMQ